VKKSNKMKEKFNYSKSELLFLSLSGVAVFLVFAVGISVFIVESRKSTMCGGGVNRVPNPPAPSPPPTAS